MLRLGKNGGVLKLESVRAFPGVGVIGFRFDYAASRVSQDAAYLFHLNAQLVGQLLVDLRQHVGIDGRMSYVLMA